MKKKTDQTVSLFLASAVFLSLSAVLLSPVAAQQKEASERPADLSDVKLAESIMMAAPYAFSYERDPFKPLPEVTRETPVAVYVEPEIKKENVPVLEGVISSGGVNRALLQVGGRTRLYRVQEKAGEYLIEYIDAKKVILKSGNSQLELKVGGDEKK